MKKIRVLRIVTSSYCVPAHLSNTLNRIPDGFEVIVVGDSVTQFESDFPNSSFIDLRIERDISVINDLIALFKLCRLIYLLKPHCIHSIMTKAGLLSSVAGFVMNVPVRVHTFTGQIWYNKSWIKQYFYKMNDRLICFLSNYCFTDSKSQSDFLFENGIKIKGNKIPFLGYGSLSGVDFNKTIFPSDFTRKNLRKELGFYDKDKIIGFIARKSIDKGGLEILKIFKELIKLDSNVSLLFIGPDESNGIIENYLIENTELNEKICSLDFVKDHFKYLSVIDILALPSHREGFGSIVIDSSSMYVPVVGYNVVGLSDSISHKVNGILVEYGNLKEFVRVLFELLHNDDYRIKLGKSSYEYAKENFSADYLSQLLFSFYEEAIFHHQN